MLFQLETGMHVNGVVIFMIERQSVKEVQVLCRNGVLDLPSRIIEILLFGDVKSSTYILLKRTFAAGDRRYPKVGASFNEIQQHLFMIATQATHSFRIFALKFHNKLNTAGRVGTPIYQVTQKNDRVGSFVAWNHLQQAFELSATPVNIPDNKSFHSAVSSRFSSDVLIPCISSLKRGSL